MVQKMFTRCDKCRKPIEVIVPYDGVSVLCLTCTMIYGTLPEFYDWCRKVDKQDEELSKGRWFL